MHRSSVLKPAFDKISAGFARRARFLRRKVVPCAWPALRNYWPTEQPQQGGTPGASGTRPKMEARSGCRSLATIGPRSLVARGLRRGSDRSAPSWRKRTGPGSPARQSTRPRLGRAHLPPAAAHPPADPGPVQRGNWMRPQAAVGDSPPRGSDAILGHSQMQPGRIGSKCASGVDVSTSARARARHEYTLIPVLVPLARANSTTLVVMFVGAVLVPVGLAGCGRVVGSRARSGRERVETEPAASIAWTHR
jgi:hypothetical protein